MSSVNVILFWMFKYEIYSHLWTEKEIKIKKEWYFKNKQMNIAQASNQVTRN